MAKGILEENSLFIEYLYLKVTFKINVTHFSTQIQHINNQQTDFKVLSSLSSGKWVHLCNRKSQKVFPLIQKIPSCPLPGRYPFTTKGPQRFNFIVLECDNQNSTGGNVLPDISEVYHCSHSTYEKHESQNALLWPAFSQDWNLSHGHVKANLNKGFQNSCPQPPFLLKSESKSAHASSKKASMEKTF